MDEYRREDSHLFVNYSSAPNSPIATPSPTILFYRSSRCQQKNSRCCQTWKVNTSTAARSLDRTRPSRFRTSSMSVCFFSLRRPSVAMQRNVLVRFRILLGDDGMKNHILTCHASQPEFARSARLSRSLHFDYLDAMPIPRCCSAVYPRGSHSRLLLPGIHRYGNCGSRRVHSGQQYVK